MENKKLVGYCHICGKESVELQWKDEDIYPGGKSFGTYNMCVWCYNIGASEPLPNCFEKNQRMGELSRAMRYLYSVLK